MSMKSFMDKFEIQNNCCVIFGLDRGLLQQKTTSFRHRLMHSYPL
jgi:hypothetical protein